MEKHRCMRVAQVECLNAEVLEAQNAMLKAPKGSPEREALQERMQQFLILNHVS